MMRYGVGMTSFGKYLRQLRQSRGFTQQDLATKLGISNTAVGMWERDINVPGTEHMASLSAIFGVSVDDLLKVRGVIPKPPPTVAPTSAQVMHARELPADIPMLGQTVGGDGGFFLQNGEIVDFVRRPPGLANQKTVFALSVIGSSMVPRYEDGDIVYVSTTRRPQIGDDVIVEMVENEDGSPGESFIKRLVRRSASAIVCEQFNPAQPLEYPSAQVKNLFRVIPWREVIGI